ncbi:MAG TPA: septum formation initiator family protein [Rhizomicrobium sp.]|jgi:cell division protein FtsB|nr:septum formation initiator family protein [Rhizomicrobium sp.]
MTRFFGILVMPAISAAAIAYFGYYTLWGTRGLLALADVKARLSVEQERLASLSDQRARLERRIHLLRAGSEDPDLIEEVARSQMLDSAPGQVVVPRRQR